MTPERRQRLLRRLRRAALWIGAAVLVLLVLTELIARLAFGLCDPALLVEDPELEYIFAPSQHCRQFGNDVAFNRYSMRSDDFPKTKSTPDEFRVMVLGDSVVFGGTKVDQRELATSRLQISLAQKLKRPVIVGNVGAGSWGPPNLLAYARRFGFFDADVVVIVVSSHDVSDTMTFEPVVGRDPSFPRTKPKLAVWEIATRYLPRFLAIRRTQQEPMPPPAPAAEPPDRVEASMAALRDLIAAARATGARVIVAQHRERYELDGHPLPGDDIIRTTAESTGVEVLQLGPSFKASIARGEQPYRDYIHPTPLGQGVLAEALQQTILDTGRAATTTPSTP